MNYSIEIAIVDDDPKLSNLVKKYLGNNGFMNVAIHSPASLLAAIDNSYQLLILDIMMPEMDGFTLLKKIREKSGAFVLFLSARNEVFDRVMGLELGADDYLCKPFEPRELLAKVQALLRRTSSREVSSGLKRLGKIEFEEFTFDLDRQIVKQADTETPLTTYEFQLLRIFCLNPNIVLSRQQIMENFDGSDFESYDRSIDVGISRLRKKLGKSSEPIRTVWGRGYQLVVEKKS